MPLRLEDTEHGELNAANANRFADDGVGILNAEVSEHRWTNHGHALLPQILLRGEHATANQLVLAHREVVRRGANHLRAGIFGLELQLQLPRHLRLHRRHQIGLFLKRGGIGHGEFGTIRLGRHAANPAHLPGGHG